LRNSNSRVKFKVEGYGLKVIFSEFVAIGIGLAIFGWLDCPLDSFRLRSMTIAQGDSSK
jgi:hypothetical protein